MSKELLFSITKRDFVVEHIRGSGPGGQHRNKTSTGVRIKHPKSGAVGVATDSKSQKTNKRNALERLVGSKEFQLWIKIETARLVRDGVTIEQAVEKQMHPKNIKTEVREGDRWVEQVDKTDR
jgi:peptide chain release factor 1